ncbi:hypothetical protein BKM63_20720 [Flavobacterium johnsoniae]|uniref:Uncharacterized protein n=2 Tax=Flavobacterium johnsoniae TaxID=986 RepID=A0A1J7BMA2_FLAJO|nr:hypothetical protein BKM63_20720 [Flavobacterium johnsoniae]
MYNLIDQKHNINSFMLSGTDIILKNEKKELFVNDKFICENVDDFFISGDNQSVLFNTIDGLSSLDKNFNLIHKKSRFFLNAVLKFSNFTFQTDIESNTILYLNNNKLEKEVELISDYDWEFLFSNQSYLYIYDKFIIKAFCYSSHNFIWKNILQEYGEIRKILGIANEKIWISMYRGGIHKNKNTLIALDSDSGQMIYQTPNNFDISDWFVELIPEHNSILSIHGKISTHPADSPLIEINAATGEIIRNQKIESLYNENLKIGFWKVLNDKIYFTANKDVLNGTHIGVLDYHTLEILWVSKVDEMRGGFRDLQVTENKIYALDTGSQLHVFARV